MQVTHQEDLAEVLTLQKQIIGGAIDTYRLEKRFVHEDGSVVWINLNVSMVRDKDERPMHLVAQIENISERVESQIKFLKQVKAIEAQNNKLREIAWIQSHVVRAPLARLMGLINLLKDKDYIGSDDDKLLEYIQVSAEELDDVIKDVTDKVYTDEDGSSPL